MRDLPNWEIEKAIAGLLGEAVETKVRNTCDTMNQRIRARLQNATGLRFGHGGRLQQVPVHVVPHLPEAFIGIIRKRNWDEPFLKWLFSDLANLQTTRRTLENLCDRYLKVEDALHPKAPAATFEDIEQVIRLIDQIVDLKQIDWPGLIGKPMDMLPGISPQVEWSGKEPFGTYSPRSQQVEIHWVAIGMFVILCDDFRHSVEDLTAVVLAHELAHAYTHVGYDTDGNQWDTDDMLWADLFVIEGLAQYYTRAVSRRLTSAQPGMLEAFADLQRFQAPWYRAYQEWAQNHPHQSEIVRHAMVDARTRGLKFYEEFRGRLDRFCDDWPG